MARVDDLARVYTDYRYWLIKFVCVSPFVLLTLAAVMIVNFDPSFSVKTFYVPALNKFINQTTVPDADADSLIFFDLELHNTYENKGLRYGAVNLTFSYAAANTTVPIGSYTVAGFYQGKGKKAQRRDVAVATGGERWREAAIGALLSGSTANFRVDLVTSVRFNNYLFYSGKERVVARGTVMVDESGRKVGEKPVELANPRAKSQKLIAIFTFVGVLVGFGLLIVFFFSPIFFLCVDHALFQD